MKRIISLLISVILLANLLGSALMASATEIKNDQGAFVNYDALVTGNYDIAPEEATAYVDGITEGVSLYPIFEKRDYEANEHITTQFKLIESLTGVNTTYETNGFCVSGDIASRYDTNSNCQVYTVDLTYDGITENPYFAFSVVTDSGTTEYAKIFGYLSDHGLFLSKCSHEDAKDESYCYLVKIGQLTMDEYNDLMRQEYSKAGITTIKYITPVDMSAVTFDQDPSTSAITTSNETSTITVSGNLSWIDDGGIRHPLQYNDVIVWDSLNDEMLGRVITDASGNYSLSFADEHAYHSIYLEISPSGSRHSVYKYNSIYFQDDEAFQNIDSLFRCISQTASDIMPGSIINIDWEIDMTSHIGQAFQISQAIGVAVQYAMEMCGTTLNRVTVYYPYDDDSYYSSKKITEYLYEYNIYISGLSAKYGYPNSYASWDVIMHEYGHHVEHEFGLSDSPGLGHRFTDNLADRHKSKQKGIQLAWPEAYASVFSGMAQAYFASSLQNINTVGDAAYTSFNGSEMDYENVLDNHRQGEACEGSIVGILWDLYDNVAESHDTISFSHSAYWDMITNSGATNISEFCNYFINTNAMNKDLALGKLLSYYKVSASDLTANLDEETPTFSWAANGVTDDWKNNKFDLIILNVNNSVTLRINSLTSPTYTLTQEEWQTVLNSYGTTYTVVVVAYQKRTPLTGGYYSESLEIAKPISNGQANTSLSKAQRYTEKKITLTPGCYFDLYVTFNATGSKLIQTFGTKDTIIEMYSATGELLVEADKVDDNGFRFNALVRYYTYANTQYKIRIRLYDENSSGTVKIAITPARGVYDYWDEIYETYEDILNFGERTSLRWDAYCELNYTSIITFTPSKTGLYTFAITSEVDTYLYVIDPRSSDLIAFGTDYDDDSGSGTDPLLTRTLEAGIPYLVIYSGYNIANENYVGDLMLNIWLEEDTE